MLTVQFLGTFRVSLGGRPLTLQMQKTRALLLYLLLDQRPQRRTALAALLWPTHDQHRALNNLANAVHQLRRLLPDGPPLISDVESTSIALSDIPLNADVRTFIELDRRLTGHAHFALERCAVCAAQVPQLLQLAAGPLVPDLELAGCEEFEDWLLQQREWFQQRAAFWRSFAVQLAVRRGELQPARDLLQQLLRDEPWREEVLLELARVHAALGERTTALRILERGLQRITDELHVQPSAEARNFVDDLRAAVPLPPPAALSILPALQMEPFARRLRETVLERLARWPQQLLSLVGPSGSGKTILAIDLARRLRGTFSGGIVFLQLQDEWDERALLFALGRLLGLPSVQTVPAFEQIIALLSRGSWLLLFDDCRRAPALAGTIAALADAAPDLTVITTSQQPLQLQRESIVTVGGLSVIAADGPSEAASFIKQRLADLLPAVTLESDQPLEQIGTALGGLPLALELVAHLLQRRALPDVLELIEHDPTALHVTVSDLPPRHRSLHAILHTGWSAVEAEFRPLLVALCCFQTPFSATAARRLIGDDRLADSALHRFELLGLLSGTRDARTIHPLIREYVTRLPEAADWIAAAQQRYSRTMLDLLAQPAVHRIGRQSLRAVEQLAAHLPDLQTAWQIACRDADLTTLERAVIGLENLAEMIGWHHPAAELLSSAAAVVDPAHASDLHARFLIGAAQLSLLNADPARCADLLDAAERTAHTALNRGLAQLLRATLQGAQLDHTGAAALLDALIADSALPERLHAAAAHHRARIALLVGDLPLARATAERALTIAARLDEFALQVMSDALLAQLPARAGDWAVALPLLETSLADARRLGSVPVLLQALGNLALARARTGCPADTVLAPAREADQLLTRSGLRTRLAFMLQSLATTYLLVGLDLQAEQLLSEALPAVRHQSSAEQLTIIKGFAHLAVNRSDYREAHRLLALVLNHPDTPPHVRATAAELHAGLPPAPATAAPPLDAVLTLLLTRYPPA